MGRERRLIKQGAPEGFQISTAKVINTGNNNTGMSAPRQPTSNQVVKSNARPIENNTSNSHSSSRMNSSSSGGKTIIKVERSSDGYMYNGEPESSFPANTP